MNVFLVFLGGGLGAVCRYGLAVAIGNQGFPWATLAANFLACLALALGLEWGSRGLLGPGAQLLLLTGFCGGFSTFSTFAYELLLLGRAGNWGVAVVYLMVSLLLGMGVLWSVSRVG